MKRNTVEYRKLHRWVEKQLGKPQKCEGCGDTKPQRYAWANLSGEYRQDVSDWRRLCYQCHAVLDYGHSYWTDEFCLHGHRLVLTNLYLRKFTNLPNRRRTLACKTCAAASSHKGWLKRKARNATLQSTL